jgi:DHA1 family bicyclomycin/chloramphenicol resistance-like MFS transporter
VGASRPVGRPPGRAEFIAICAILMATVSLAIDLMLPALGDMADDLRFGDDNQRQWIITALFVGLAVGQLLFGALSDGIGRKSAIGLGIAVFVAGSLLCVLATSFETMMLGRVVQGFGAAGPQIGTVALIRDRFSGREMARVMSVIMGLFILVPILAPVVGQVLLILMPWRGLFGVLAVLCLGGGVWLMLRQAETLSERRSLQPHALLEALFEVLKNPKAMTYTLAGGCCYGSLMGYINPSQQLFQNLYRVGDLYAALFGVSAAFISAGTLVNARLVRHVAMERVCILAVGTIVAWSLLALAALPFLGSPPPLWAWMVFNCPVLFLLGLTFGNFNAVALRDLGHLAGLASAVVASLTSTLSLLIAAWIGQGFDMTPRPLVLGYAAFGAVALGLMFLPETRAAKRTR